MIENMEFLGMVVQDYVEDFYLGYPLLWKFI